MRSRRRRTRAQTLPYDLIEAGLNEGAVNWAGSMGIVCGDCVCRHRDGSRNAATLSASDAISGGGLCRRHADGASRSPAMATAGTGGAAPRAEPGPGGGGALAVTMTVLHEDSHLLVGDGFARHGGTSVLVTETPVVSARSGQHLRNHSLKKTIAPVAPASSRATPGLRLEPPANLADGTGALPRLNCCPR